jgi:hypothetical protein
LESNGSAKEIPPPGFKWQRVWCDITHSYDGHKLQKPRRGRRWQLVPIDGPLAGVPSAERARRETKARAQAVSAVPW